MTIQDVLTVAFDVLAIGTYNYFKYKTPSKKPKLKKK
jgi:hypothetical protein